MAKTKVKNARKQILPEALQSFIARRLIDGAGLFVLLGGIFILTIIFTYNHQDPSFNTITNADIAGTSNLGGSFGATISDILAQSFGLAAIMLGLIPMIWGTRVLRRQAIRAFPLRLAALLFATISFSIGLSIFPAGEFLSQPYLGGSAGVMMNNSISGLLPEQAASIAHMIIPILCLALASLSAAFATGLSSQEWQNIFYNIKTALAYVFAGLAYAVAAIHHWFKRHGAYEPTEVAPLPKLALPKFKFTPPKQDTTRQNDVMKEKVQPQKETKATPLAAPPPAIETSDSTAENKKNFKVITPKESEGAKPLSPKGQQIKLNLDPNSEWELPSLDLLAEPPAEHKDNEQSEDQLQDNAGRLQNVLNDFNVKGDIVSIHPGPVVTLYELEPAPGTKSSRVINLSDDIARSMSAVSVRAAVVPGRNVIGIELPNHVRQTVYLRNLIESRDYARSSANLPLILGNNIGGHPVIADLSKMPHLLVAGTTGSGKSVAVNTMILSLLYRLPPEKCRFIMIDPKMLELSVYDDIPHLLSPVVTEPGRAVVALKWVVQEMENRYRAMSKLGVRNIDGYNKRVNEARKKGEVLLRKVQTGFDAESGRPVYEDQPLDLEELPYIVVVVDEFADLMLVAGKDVENAIQRLAQMARAAGIHLIMATQRPSVDVITGVIKANFPTRISFSVTSKIDSRTILGEGGAEQLLGMGDMLYMAAGGRITRVHGPFASDKDVEKVVQHIKAQGAPAYLDEITEGGEEGGFDLGGASGEGGGSDVDELYDKAVAIVASERRASTSFIQRHLQIGYNRAARIIEEMERQGVVGPANHVGKREILVADHGVDAPIEY